MHQQKTHFISFHLFFSLLLLLFPCVFVLCSFCLSTNVRRSAFFTLLPYTYFEYRGKVISILLNGLEEGNSEQNKIEFHCGSVNSSTCESNINRHVCFSFCFTIFLLDLFSHYLFPLDSMAKKSIDMSIK